MPICATQQESCKQVYPGGICAGNWPNVSGVSYSAASDCLFEDFNCDGFRDANEGCMTSIFTGSGQPPGVAFFTAPNQVGSDPDFGYDPNTNTATLTGGTLSLVSGATAPIGKSDLRSLVASDQPPGLSMHRQTQATRGDFLAFYDSQANATQHPLAAVLEADFTLRVRRVQDSSYQPRYWEPAKWYAAGERVVFGSPPGDRLYRATIAGASGPARPTGIPYPWQPNTQFQTSDLLVSLVINADPGRLYAVAPKPGEAEACINQRFGLGTLCCTTGSELAPDLIWPTTPGGTVDTGTCRLTCQGACALGDAWVANVADGDTAWTDPSNGTTNSTTGRNIFYPAWTIGGDGGEAPMGPEDDASGPIFGGGSRDDQRYPIFEDRVRNHGGPNGSSLFNQTRPRFATITRSIRSGVPDVFMSGHIMMDQPRDDTVAANRIDNPEFAPQLTPVATGNNALTTNTCYWVGFWWESAENGGHTELGPMARAHIVAPNNAFNIRFPAGCPTNAARAVLFAGPVAGPCTETRPLFIGRRGVALNCSQITAPGQHILAWDLDDFGDFHEVPHDINTTGRDVVEIYTMPHDVNAWTASTTYTFSPTGAVVRPTNANRNGFQYKLWRVLNGTTQCFSNPTEPAWPAAGATVVDGDCEWKHRGREPTVLTLKGPNGSNPGAILTIRDSGVGVNGDRVTAYMLNDGGIALLRSSGVGNYRNDVSYQPFPDVLGSGRGGFGSGPGQGTPLAVYDYSASTGLRERKRVTQNGQSWDYPLLTMQGATSGDLATTGVEFFPANATLAANAVESTVTYRTPGLRVWAGWCSVSTAPGGSATRTCQLRDDAGNVTGAACTITGTATTCHFTLAAPVAISDGSAVAWQETPATTPAAARMTGAILYNMESSGSGLGW